MSRLSTTRHCTRCAAPISVSSPADKQAISTSVLMKKLYIESKSFCNEDLFMCCKVGFIRSHECMCCVVLLHHCDENSVASICCNSASGVRVLDRFEVATAAGSSEGQRSGGAQFCRAANHSDSRTASQLCSQSSWTPWLLNSQSFHASSDGDVPDGNAIGDTEAAQQALNARIHVVLVLDPPYWGSPPPPPPSPPPHTHTCQLPCR